MKNQSTIASVETVMLGEMKHKFLKSGKA